MKPKSAIGLLVHVGYVAYAVLYIVIFFLRDAPIVFVFEYSHIRGILTRRGVAPIDLQSTTYRIAYTC